MPNFDQLILAGTRSRQGLLMLIVQTACQLMLIEQVAKPFGSHPTAVGEPGHTVTMQHLLRQLEQWLVVTILVEQFTTPEVVISSLRWRPPIENHPPAVREP